MGALILAIILVLAIVLGWHLLFPLIGGVLAITGIVWFFLVGSIAAFCIALLLILIVTGTGIFVVGALALVWTIVAIVLFPILFPILLPLFIILLVISYLRRKKKLQIK